MRTDTIPTDRSLHTYVKLLLKYLTSVFVSNRHNIILLQLWLGYICYLP